VRRPLTSADRNVGVPSIHARTTSGQVIRKTLAKLQELPLEKVIEAFAVPAPDVRRECCESAG